MGTTLFRLTAALSLSALALSACEGNIGGSDHSASLGPGGNGFQGGSLGGGPGGGSSLSGGGASAGTSSGTGTAGTMTDAGVGGTLVDPNAASPLLPARIRRLTDAEFDTSVKSLLGFDSTFGASFTPDTRQDGFSRNDAQRVDPVFISQLQDAAQQLATTARGNVNNLAPCSDQGGSEACAKTFLTTFAARAYRRPATDAEVTALLTVYRVGADGATYADGIQATIQAVLESPGFLYVTELGDTPLQAKTTLNQYELASALAYLVTGSPPDDTLLAAAKAGDLSDPAKRQSQLDRLLALQPASTQVVRLVEEWLGIDAITQTAKDSNTYPGFAALRDSMKKEADDFTAEVMWKNGGSVGDLLSANWTIADDSLARMYLNLDQNGAIPRNGNHVDLSSVIRRGILDQGAFLSIYAHATETSPVLRGVAVLRRVACFNIPSPQSLNITVVPVVADPSKTTRDRFAQHVSDKVCASCHTNIDSIGFTFEDLDGMGQERPRQMENGALVHTENGMTVDSSTTVQTGLSFDGNYADSSALDQALGASPDVLDCFARKLFRNAATRSDPTVAGAETAFLTTAFALAPTAQGKVHDLLSAFVASDAFVNRRASE
ncbi:MAG TPA: DUF1592 domain-containing protein [Polyangiaceae bacterium]|jgi:hypothetical protein|nr:DUF1592 domain-containing protein [Polyangiaceae bacterium]